MPPLNLLSASAQVAAHLRTELHRGNWSHTMPGVNRLAAELGVNRKTVEAALRQIESEGFLLGQGAGRKRLIMLPAEKVRRSMRVAILLHEGVPNRQLNYIVELQHALVEAGHSAIFPTKSLVELGMKVSRVERLVAQTEVDAWVVCAGSLEVLEWFCARSEPSFALFGRRAGLPIAASGPDKPPAYADAARQLIVLGHHRIALLCRKIRRHPEPGRPERSFLDELESHGIPTGDYNLPEWEETSEGFQELLQSLFRVTPPTALIIDEAPLFVATQQFLARSGMRVPEEVSLVCTDADPTFSWCQPSIAHIRWDSRPIVRRIVRWATAVSRGRQDVRQTLVPAEFVAGGTVGQVSKD